MTRHPPGDVRRHRFAAGVACAAVLATAACGVPGKQDVTLGASPATVRLVGVPPGLACPGPRGPATSGHTGVFGDVTLRCLRAGPDVQLRDLGGGMPVLVNLWASWCLPCQREMPRLQKLADATRGRLLVLGVDTQDPSDSARSFLRAIHSTYPQVVDPRGLLRTRLHAVGLPETVLIDANGQIVYRNLGELSTADLGSALRAANGTLSSSLDPADQ